MRRPYGGPLRKKVVGNRRAGYSRKRRKNDSCEGKDPKRRYKVRKGKIKKEEGKRRWKAVKEAIAISTGRWLQQT